MTETPLTTTSADALTALFEADPLKLSDTQLITLVSELCRRRSAFAADEAAKAAAGKSKRPKATPQPAPSAAALDVPVAEIGLEDL